MMSGQETQARQAWHEIVCDTLKRNSIQLVTDRFMRGMGTKG
jgi:hypothetical protein